MLLSGRLLMAVAGSASVTPPVVGPSAGLDLGTSSGTTAVDLTGGGALPDMGLLEDDMLFLSAYSDQGLAGGGGENFGGFAGGQSAVDIIAPVTTGSPGYRVSYIRMTSSPLTSVTIQQNFNRRISLIFARIRGINWSNVLDGTPAETHGGSANTMPDPPSYTVNFAGGLAVISAGLDDCEIIDTPAAPSGFTGLVSNFADGGGATSSASSLFAYSSSPPSPGSLNPGAFTAGAAVVSSAYSAFTIVFRGS